MVGAHDVGTYECESCGRTVPNDTYCPDCTKRGQLARDEASWMSDSELIHNFEIRDWDGHSKTVLAEEIAKRFKESLDTNEGGDNSDE